MYEEPAIQRYEVEQIAEDRAYDAKRDAIREFEEALRIEREDNRTSHQDIRDGVSELADRLWHIEVKLGIRKDNGEWIGYGESTE